MFRISIFFAVLAISSAVNIPENVNFNIPKDFTAPNEVLSAISDNIANKFTEEYLQYRKTGVESEALRKISTQLAQMHSEKDIFTKEHSELSAADSFFLCTTCRATANVAARMVRDADGELNGPNKDENAKILTLEFCRRFDLQTEEVCLGLYESNWPTINYIGIESKMDGRTFCSMFLGLNLCKVSKNPEYNFTLDINSNGPSTQYGPKNAMPKRAEDNISVLHISDLHYDPLYLPGSLAGCKEPLCCQRHKDIAEEENKSAGYWGDYRDCDAPWHMIENALEHMKKTHKNIEYIYHTGDVVDHMVWARSRKGNMEVLQKVDDALEKIFPGVKVYSCIGNHEPQPVNAFSPTDVPDEVNTNWLYEHLYKSWSRWLPASTKDTILKGGYYTDSPKAGFRVIVLNNNDCYNMNWWLFYSGQDKAPQLQWLHDTLLAAEKANEYVHILQHVPTGGESCWSVWSREFNRIVERFNHIISGIFNGHSHKDEMFVHYSSKGHAIGVVWNGGSITPASNKNPNYRFYNMDKNSMEVTEAKTWYFNLADANIYGADRAPIWKEMYDFAEEYTQDLSPYGIDQLFDKFAEQPTMLRKFWRYKETLADPRLQYGCDRQCLMETICRMSTTVSNQLTRCHELQLKLKKSLDNEDLPSTTESPTQTSRTTTTEHAPTSTTQNTSTNEPDENGASSIATMKIISILAVYVVVKNIL